MNPVTSMRSLGPRYIALWVGQTISGLGTYIAFLTIPLLVLHIQKFTGTGSVLDFSIAYALETAPTLLVGLAGGVLLDRWHLRPVMVATDLLRASAFFYLAAEVGNYGTSTVFVMAFLIGSMTTLFDGALYSLIPSLVKRERLADANAYVAASQQANFALGPLVAGVMAVVFAGPALGLFINGLTFVASAISLKWVGRVAHHRSPEDERAPFFTEAVNGIRYLWAEPRLRITTIASAVPNFVMGFIEATFVVLAFEVLMAESEIQVGILLFAMGVGGVVGALIAPRITRRLGLGRALVVGMAIAGVGLFLVMFTTYSLLTLALQAGWMFGVSVINIPLATIRQHYAAESMLGRVITASRAIGWATLPLGALIGGWLGASGSTYPWVARSFPLLLMATALWLYTTVVWADTFGPGFELANETAADADEAKAVDEPNP
ncbi:MAG: MFS transporter [Actinobacteria bacterium]|nr:MFS transporter [Actinomycetota bacterium]